MRGIPKIRPSLAIMLLAGCLLGDLDADLEDACGHSLLDDKVVEVDGTVAVENSTALDFDGASAFLTYSDQPADDQCVFEAAITLQKGGEFGGCELTIRTVPLIDGDGRLLIDSVGLESSDSCPTWDTDASLHTQGDGPFGTVAVLGEVRGSDGTECYDDEVIVELGRTEVTTATGEGAVLGPTTLTLRGDFGVLSQTASCPTPA